MIMAIIEDDQINLIRLYKLFYNVVLLFPLLTN